MNKNKNDLSKVIGMAIRSIATKAIWAIETYDVALLEMTLEECRTFLAEARQCGVEEKRIQEILDGVLRSHPNVKATWPKILEQIEVYVWLEDPDGNRVRGDTLIVDGFVWENYEHRVVIEEAVQQLHDDLEVGWEVLSNTPSQVPTA
jgi:hypothetical protein